MARKIIVCRCEDVTVADLERAVATGFADLEEVKRYTGFGTGPCQGKECQRNVALLLARITNRPPGDLAPFTSRPPLAPTALKLLAGDRGDGAGLGPAQSIAGGPGDPPTVPRHDTRDGAGLGPAQSIAGGPGDRPTVPRHDHRE